jgi:hypothetical protein
VRDLRESYPLTSKRLIASSFLLRTRTVSCDATNLSLTELCLKYLSLPAFSHTGLDDHVRQHARIGTFAFFEYALSSWTAHLEHTLYKRDTSVSPPASLERVLQDFFQMHWMPAKRQTRPPKWIQELADRTFHFEDSAKIKACLSSMHCLMTTNLSDMEAVYTLDLFSFLKRVRAIIENLNTQPGFGFEMQQFYGQQLYKCPRIYCRYFHEGFVDFAQRDSHVERHYRSHLRKVVGCIHASLRYPRAEHLARHQKAVHPEITTDEEFSTLLDAGAQVDDGTQVDDRASENLLGGDAEGHTRKHPATFGCTVTNCLKRFTRASILRSHLLTHTDQRPFDCTVCGKAFSRQNDRKRHEARHGGKDRKNPPPVMDP